jgi:hypothetical protein
MLVSSLTAEKMITKVVSGQIIKKQTGFTPIGHAMNLLNPEEKKYDYDRQRFKRIRTYTSQVEERH